HESPRRYGGGVSGLVESGGIVKSKQRLAGRGQGPQIRNREQDGIINGAVNQSEVGARVVAQTLAIGAGSLNGAPNRGGETGIAKIARDHTNHRGPARSSNMRPIEAVGARRGRLAHRVPGRIVKTVIAGQGARSARKVVYEEQRDNKWE